MIQVLALLHTLVIVDKVPEQPLERKVLLQMLLDLVRVHVECVVLDQQSGVHLDYFVDVGYFGLTLLEMLPVLVVPEVLGEGLLVQGLQGLQGRAGRPLLRQHLHQQRV